MDNQEISIEELIAKKIKMLNNKNATNQEIENEILNSYDDINIEFDISKESLKEIIPKIIRHVKEEYPYTYVNIVDESLKKNEKTIATSPRSCWQLLKKSLINKKIYDENEIMSLEEGTVKLLNNLAEKTTPKTVVKGLIMGHVQSGKTTSMEALIAMASDNGWNFFIVLSGMIDNLRKQTLGRMNADMLGAGRGNLNLEFVERIEEGQLDNMFVEKYNKRVITVCLKNSKRLEKLRELIEATSDMTKQKMKILIIDDEADQASLNTNKLEKDERTKINKEILNIINIESIYSMNYIAYTATPYGNFLNESADYSLYPKDFICMLPKSYKYIGPLEIFGGETSENIAQNDGLNVKRNIPKVDLSTIGELEKNNRFFLPISLRNAICWFICTVAIKRFQKSKKPVSMLIHTNIKVDTHENISKAIMKWLDECGVDLLIKECEKIYNTEIEKINAKDFLSVMTRYDMNIQDYPKFNEIKEHINELLQIPRKGYINMNSDGKLNYHKGIHMVIDNCAIDKTLQEDEFARLEYPKEDIGYATAFIIVGGNTLSRGLTIEGLTTTYFTRTVSQMDTLMQMGRWFGYKVGSELLFRIWLDEMNLIKFNDMTVLEEELKNDLAKYEDEAVSPKNYGPRIKNNFDYKVSVTAKNKMQSAQEILVNFEGIKKQTTIFENNIEILKSNIEVVESFIKKIGKLEYSKTVKTNLIKKNIDFNIINDFLLSKFKFCDKNVFFANIKSLCNWVSKTENEKFKKWNIIIAGVKNQENISKWTVDNGQEIGKVQRSKLINASGNNEYIDLKILRNSTDVISDLEEYNGSTDSRIIEEERAKLKVPQLIIYRIDKDSKAKENAKNREDLKSNVDLMGIYIFVPSENNKKNEMMVTIKLPQEIIEDKEGIEYAN